MLRVVKSAIWRGQVCAPFKKSLHKKLDGANIKMLRVVKNVTWRQRITDEVLYAGLPRIWTTIRERRLRFNGHCRRSKNEVVSDLVLWEPKHDKRSVGGQAHILSIFWRRTPRSPETACRQRWMTGLAGEREPWGGGGGMGGGGGRSTEVDLVVVVESSFRRGSFFQIRVIQVTLNRYSSGFCARNLAVYGQLWD